MRSTYRRILAAIIVIGAFMGYFTWRMSDATDRGTPRAPKSPSPKQVAAVMPPHGEIAALPTAAAAEAPTPTTEARRPQGNAPQYTPESNEEERARRTMQDRLTAAFEEHLPEQALSAEEYERLAEAVLRVQAARRGLVRVVASADPDAVIRERAELLKGLSDFESTAHIGLEEFNRLADSKFGLNEEEGEASASDEERD